MSVSELTLLVLRLGFLLLLWLFIFGIVYALRSDLFGQRVRKLPTDAASPAPAAAFPTAAPAPVAAPVAAAAALTEPVTAAPFAGGSSGAAYIAASWIAQESQPSDNVVVLFPDRGDRYLSEAFWNGAEHKVSAHTTSDVLEAVDGITVPDDVLDAIRDHGAETFPYECCGVLLGDEDGRVQEAFALSNTTSGDAST